MRREPLRLAEEVGPQLGFHHEDHIRSDATQEAAANPGQIQGREQDRIGGGGGAADFLPAGARGGSKDDPNVREAAAQLLGEGGGDLGLPERNGVEPGDRTLAAGPLFRQESETLGETGKAPTNGAERGPQDQQRAPQPNQKIIKKIHRRNQESGARSQ